MAADKIVTVVVVVILLLVGTVIVTSITGDSDGITSDTTRDAALLSGTSFSSLNDGKGTSETVYETTGYAVNLSGADDSYVRSKGDFDIATDNNWTVAVWAYVDQGAGNSNMTAMSADGQVIITYNGTNSQWQAWYYDEGARNSYVVNVSTSGDEVGNWTHVMAWANGTHLSVYRNNTQGEIQNITVDSIESAPVDAGNWNGRLEELRTFDRALDATNRTNVFNAQAEETPDIDPTSRAMFDQPDRSTQLLLYTGTSLEQSSVTFSQGFAEQVMTEGTDYAWDEEGPQVRAVAGGDLDGAPVAYASYDYDTALSGILDGWGSVMEIAAMVPIVIIAALLLFRVQGLE